MSKWLEAALDMEITELEFWQMTIAEVNRAIKAKARVQRVKAREKAAFDYILAQLITKGVNIAFNGKGDFPTFNEVYESLLEEEKKEENKEKKQELITELSTLRFKMFAQSFNKRFEEVAKDNNE